MIKAAIEKIEQMSKTEIVREGGRSYSTRPLNLLMHPQPHVLQVNTLTGLSDLCRNRVYPDPGMLVFAPIEVEGAVKPEVGEREGYIPVEMVHIESESSVIVYGPLDEVTMQRPAFYKAQPFPLDVPYGRYLPIEEFIIMLRVKFIATPDRAAVINFVSDVSDKSEVGFTDDGISQKVTVKTGIQKVAEGDVPSEASLRPYRTFIELDQPESVFILRAKKGASGIEFALFEADGGKWRIEAIQSIHAFLQQSLPDLQIIA